MIGTPSADRIDGWRAPRQPSRAAILLAVLAAVILLFAGQRRAR